MLTFVSWRRLGLACSSVCATAFIFLSERVPGKTASLSLSPHASGADHHSSVAALTVPSTPLIDPLHPALFIISVMPANAPAVIPAAAVAAAQPKSTVAAILTGILAPAPTSTVRHVFLSMLSDVPTTAAVNFKLSFSIVTSSVPSIIFISSYRCVCAGFLLSHFCSTVFSVVCKCHSMTFSNRVCSYQHFFLRASDCLSAQTYSALLRGVCRN